tara:strand:- start:5344 stop:6486 length:1143 start_codon:yes stop_codon:yes gene_type:complete
MELSNKAKDNLKRIFGDNIAEQIIAQYESVEDSIIFKQIEKSWETDFASIEEYDANSLLTQPEILGLFNQTILENNKLIGLSSVNPEGVTKGELDSFLIEVRDSDEFKSVLSLTTPTLGTINPEMVREGFIPEGTEGVVAPATSLGVRPTPETTYSTDEEEALAELFSETDEWFIKENIGEVLNYLPDDQKALIAIELAFVNIGNMGDIFRSDGSFDNTAFNNQMLEAYRMMEIAKPTLPVTDVGGVPVPAQFGTGDPTTFNILTGQSGRTVEEIQALFELGITQEREEEGYKDYDPVYLMDAVNNKAGQMLGIELTEAQKRAFVVFMKETVDHYYTDNMQMPMVDSQAKKFVQEEFPKLSLAEAEGSTIRAIEAAVRNM